MRLNWQVTTVQLAALFGATGELLAFARFGFVESGSQSPFSLASYMRSYCLDYRSAEGVEGNLREPEGTIVVIIIKESPDFRSSC